jgi:zinc protease
MKFFALLGRTLIALLFVTVGMRSAAAVTIEKVVSPLGIEAWLVRDSSIPLVSMSFLFRGGSALDPVGKEGLANMTAALLDEGAGDMDSQAFQGRLEDLSISLGFGAGRDNFSGNLRTLSRNRAEAFSLLRDALTKARFDAEPVARIRDQIISGIEAREQDPNTIAGRTFAEEIYGDHPYARPSGGTPETVGAITVADMRGLVQQRLARDNLIIGVVGDIGAAELATALDDIFGELPAKAAPWHIDPAETAFDGRVLTRELDIPQSVILFAQPGLPRHDPDYYAAYVMNHILGGGGFSSRLYTEVREERGLAYSASSYLSSSDGANILAGSAATQNSRVAETVRVVREVWRRMQEEGPSDEEVEAAIRFLTGSWALRFDRSSAIAGMLSTVQEIGLGIDYLDRRNAILENLTPDQVRSAARRLLDPDRLTFVIVGKPDPAIGEH